MITMSPRNLVVLSSLQSRRKLSNIPMSVRRFMYDVIGTEALPLDIQVRFSGSPTRVPYPGCRPDARALTPGPDR